MSSCQKPLEQFFADVRVGRFSEAIQSLEAGTSSTPVDEKGFLASLIDLYRGQLWASPQTILWERVLGYFIREFPATLGLIEMAGMIYIWCLRAAGATEESAFSKMRGQLMPGIVQYRYTNFLKGTIQASFLRGAAKRVNDHIWAHYLKGYRAHCLCILGRFDIGLRDLKTAVTELEFEITYQKTLYRTLLFTNLTLEIKTARAFHAGYAGHIEEAEGYYNHVFAIVESEPSFYIEGLVYSMRTATSLEMLRKEWLRDDVNALRKLYSGTNSDWWSLRAASYSALTSATEGNLDHTARLLKTCEHYYKNATNRFEIMRYHFVRALIELELGSPQNACLHARRSRDFVLYIPGAQFHQSESVVHEIEVTTRALLFEVHPEISVSALRGMKRRLQKAVSKVRGCETLNLKAKVLGHLIDHLMGIHFTSAEGSIALRAECTKRSARMLNVFSSFDCSGTGKAPQMTRTIPTNELQDTAVIQKIGLLAKGEISDVKICEVLQYLLAADSVTAEGTVPASSSKACELREVGVADLQVVFKINSTDAICFTAHQPNFQLGFDTYLEVYLDLISAIVRQYRLMEAEKRSKELESKIEVYGKVAHDIRSPLSALNMFARLLIDVDEEKKRFLHSAIKRINDIANELLHQRDDLRRVAQLQESSVTVFLPYLIEPLLNEKRLEFAGRAEIELEFEQDEPFNGFISCDPIRMKRLLSNLINNAVESGSARVQVQLRMNRPAAEVELIVKDQGKGMTDNLMAQLGQRPFSFGKSRGNGIGLFSAYELMKLWGGQIQIDSKVGEGTSITMKFRAQKIPSWYSGEKLFSETSQLVLIDDDATQKKTWERFLTLRNLNSTLTYYSTVEDVDPSRVQDGSSLFLVDYDLNAKATGLDFILEKNLESRAILVTDNYDDSAVMTKCEKHRVRLFPKHAVTRLNLGIS